MTLSHAENATRQVPAPRNWRRIAERVGPILLIVVLVVLWEVLTRAFEVPNFLLPAPTDVARLMVAEWPLIQMHSIATIGSILSGYIAAALFALLVSALMIRFPLFERLIMPIFVGLQSVPKIAIAPLILVWVGAGLGSKILVVASIAFFPIVINTMAGFKEVDRGLADVFRSVAASERQMFLRLRQWLDPLPDTCLGVDVARLRADALAARGRLEELGPERMAEFDAETLPPLQFEPGETA